MHRIALLFVAMTCVLSLFLADLRADPGAYSRRSSSRYSHRAYHSGYRLSTIRTRHGVHRPARYYSHSIGLQYDPFVHHRPVPYAGSRYYGASHRYYRDSYSYYGDSYSYYRDSFDRGDYRRPRHAEVHVLEGNRPYRDDAYDPRYRSTRAVPWRVQMQREKADRAAWIEATREAEAAANRSDSTSGTDPSKQPEAVREPQDVKKDATKDEAPPLPRDDAVPKNDPALESAPSPPEDSEIQPPAPQGGSGARTGPGAREVAARQTSGNH